MLEGFPLEIELLRQLFYELDRKFAAEAGG